MDHVKLEKLRFEAIVGILDFERITPQPIELDVSLQIDLLQCGQMGRLELGVDYASVMDELMFLTKAGQFELLESLCLAACTLLLHPPHRIAPEKVSVAATKPTILAPHTSPCVAMQATMQRIPAPAVTAAADGVTIARVLDTPQVRVELAHIQPQTRWSSERPFFSYQLGSALSKGERARAVLRPTTSLPKQDAPSDWLIITRL